MYVRPPQEASASAACATVVSPSLHWSTEDAITTVPEPLVIEAPLAIEIAFDRGQQRVTRTLAVTMRTPGHDQELAMGFLRGEGLIAHPDDVTGCQAREANARGEKIATQHLLLARAPREDLERVSRGLVTSSACGLCGRVSLEGLPMRAAGKTAGDALLAGEMILGLPDKLRREQQTFLSTGGSHGAALCSLDGEVLLAREDVGRHNAVDKIMGAALLGGIATEGNILVLSGRASFELLQKAAAAGVAVVVAVGAPSSLAVKLAHEAGITLLGFTRGSRFNIYSHAERIELRAKRERLER